MISGDTNAVVSFNPVQSADGASYSVIVTNQYGSITTDPVTLTVTNAPIVIVPLGLSLATNSFSFGFSLPQGLTYVVLASVNGENWTPLATNVSSSTNMVFKDTSSGNYRSRLYRIAVR